jgi:TolB protein
VVVAREGDLYLANLDGSGETRLTDTPERGVLPKFSPDGATILFLNSARNAPADRLDSDLYRMNADGTGRTRLTETGREGGATFSRDGATIYFSSFRDGDWEMYSMAADGAGERRLTARPGYDGMPAAL